MARRKREPMSEGKKNIIAQLIEEYDIKTAEDIQDALKDLLGGTIQEMLESEMDEHLGYEVYERSDNSDHRNGKKAKKVRSKFGETEIEVPQERDGTFEPKVVKKRQKDISDIESKIISLYAKGMTTRQISETIEDIYGFEVSDGLVSDITDKIIPQIEDWQKRPLDSVYPIGLIIYSFIAPFHLYTEFGIDSYIFIVSANARIIPLESAIQTDDPVSEKESITAEKCFIVCSTYSCAEKGVYHQLWQTI